jgi:hypothetical protein
VLNGSSGDNANDVLLMMAAVSKRRNQNPLIIENHDERVANGIIMDWINHHIPITTMKRRRMNKIGQSRQSRISSSLVLEEQRKTRLFMCVYLLYASYLEK